MNRILACIPTYDGPDPAPFFRFLIFSYECGRAYERGQYEVKWSVSNPRVPVCMTRNIACNAAVEGGASHIFFADDDILLFPGILEHLLKLDLPIVSPIFFRSGDNEDPLCFTEVAGRCMPMYNYPVDEVFPALTGTGVMLIKTEVLAALEYPWFFDAADQSTRHDTEFCKRATKAGFPSYCDSRVLVEQMGVKKPVGLTQWNERRLMKKGTYDFPETSLKVPYNSPSPAGEGLVIPKDDFSLPGFPKEFEYPPVRMPKPDCK